MPSFDLGRCPPVAFGTGRFQELGEIVAGVRLGTGPTLLIADSAMFQTGHADAAARGLSATGGVEVADEICGEPGMDQVGHLRQRARASRCSAIVALGGGATMDAAKLAGALANSDDPVDSFALATAPLPADGVPVVAVPTTAGTGAEATPTSVVSSGSGRKLWFWGPELMPARILLDPQLTLTLPERLTAWTGIDAVAHAIEARTGRHAHPGCALVADEALRLATRWLPRAVERGDDIEARERMLWASFLAGIALRDCNTHLGHNISHALGSLTRIHHGLATGLALDVALPWLVSRRDGAPGYAAAAVALGGNADPADLPTRFAALLGRVGIDWTCAQQISDLDPATLSGEMNAPANRVMAQNAACSVSDGDLDQLARLIVAKTA